MPKCAKCNKFLPPFVCQQVNENDYLCVYCLKELGDNYKIETLNGNKTKLELVKEYDEFLKEIKFKAEQKGKKEAFKFIE